MFYDYFLTAVTVAPHAKRAHSSVQHFLDFPHANRAHSSVQYFLDFPHANRAHNSVQYFLDFPHTTARTAVCSIYFLDFSKTSHDFQWRNIIIKSIDRCSCLADLNLLVRSHQVIVSLNNKVLGKDSNNRISVTVIRRFY
jgi:hypothetical protein